MVLWPRPRSFPTRAPASLLRPSGVLDTRRAFVLPVAPGPMGYAPPGPPAANFCIIQGGTPYPVVSLPLLDRGTAT